MKLNPTSMPNGNPHFNEEELPALEEFFSRIGGVLTRFADDFNLTVARYWHQFPSWRFTFKHPKGGLACIEVMKSGESEIEIYGYWWVDDFDQATRYSHGKVCTTYRLEDLELYDLLKDRLERIVSWTRDDLTDVSSGLEEAWSIFKKEDFLRFNDRYSLPRV